MKKSAIIIGIKGKLLNKSETNFLKSNNPMGVILFARNIDNKMQTIKLVKNIKTILGRNTMILIDQEGGRVSRLSIKHWPRFPSAKIFGDKAKDNMNNAKLATYKNYKKIGKILFNLGINVNCAPVLDLLFKGSHNVIGDRSFSRDPKIVSMLALEACKGLISEGVMPIIKHIPGHGRSKNDSHFVLPEITSKESELMQDFYPFTKLNNKPLAMIAHIKYAQLDNKYCATYSKKVIKVTIRKKIGFKGILLSDDLCMKALKGPYYHRAKKAIKAGCDIILHCDANISTTLKSCKGAGFVSDSLTRKINQFKKINFK